MIGVINTIAPSTTAPAIIKRPRLSARTKNSNGNAQNKHRYNGFTRNQQATPKTVPAANDQPTDFRLTATTSSQSPPITNHVVGASAEGATPTIAIRGDSAA